MAFIIAIRYVNSASFFYLHCKKHFCPRCGTKVELGYDRKIVNAKSPEIKNVDFANIDTFMIGDIKFIIRCFYCPDCQVNISFKDMKIYERELKIRNRKEDDVNGSN